MIVNDEALLALQFERDPSSFEKLISDSEKKNWSSWPSNLAKSFKNNKDRATVKKMTIH